MAYPLEQGLKRRCRAQSPHPLGRVLMAYPLEQGLKLRKKLSPIMASVKS